MSLPDLPHFTRGTVVNGFGRGSKELGIPTANLPAEAINNLPKDLKPGVYYGWAKVDNGKVNKMVMSIGWNPFYKNKRKSMEVHILNKFERDFYNCTLSIIIVDFIRPEKDFSSVEDLIKTIEADIEIAKKELDKPQYLLYRTHKFFSEPFERICKCR